MPTTPPPYVDIGKRLMAVRQGFSSLNRKEWASKHDFAETRYYNWEAGSRRITVDEAQKLCDIYGLSLDWIYRGRRDGLSESSRNVV